MSSALSSPPLRLEVRTPTACIYSGNVLRIRAEDLDGWFGIRPGRPDLLSVLPPGLIVFEDEQGEAYVANGGGVLNLAAGNCRIALHSAVFTRTELEVAQALERERDKRHRSQADQREVVDVLLKEALRRATDATEDRGERWP